MDRETNDLRDTMGEERVPKSALPSRRAKRPKRRRTLKYTNPITGKTRHVRILRKSLEIDERTLRRFYEEHPEHGAWSRATRELVATYVRKLREKRRRRVADYEQSMSEAVLELVREQSIRDQIRRIAAEIRNANPTLTHRQAVNRAAKQAETVQCPT